MGPDGTARCSDEERLQEIELLDTDRDARPRSSNPNTMSGYRHRHISFLSDYGSTDEFAGVCRGVILRIAPEAIVIDVTHGIRPQDVHEGALVLARSVSYLPAGVHLAVVDPGVGSGRLPVAVVAADGSVLVGPDNGLLLPAATRLGGVVAAHCIENPEIGRASCRERV